MLTSWPYSSVVVLFEASVVFCAVPTFHDLILLFAVSFIKQLLGLSGWLTDPFGVGPLHFLFQQRAMCCDLMVCVCVCVCGFSSLVCLIGPLPLSIS